MAPVGGAAWSQKMTSVIDQNPRFNWRTHTPKMRRVYPRVGPIWRCWFFGVLLCKKLVLFGRFLDISTPPPGDSSWYPNVKPYLHQVRVVLPHLHVLQLQHPRSWFSFWTRILNQGKFCPKSHLSRHFCLWKHRKNGSKKIGHQNFDYP